MNLESQASTGDWGKGAYSKAESIRLDAQAALKLAQKPQDIEPFDLREALAELRRTREERDALKAKLEKMVDAKYDRLTALVDAVGNVQQRADVANLVAQDKALKAAQQVLNA